MKQTNKQKIVDLVSKMPDDVSWEEAGYRLELLRRVEVGRQQANEGKVVDDQQLEEWLAQNGQEDASHSMDNGGVKKPRRDKTVHRA